MRGKTARGCPSGPVPSLGHHLHGSPEMDDDNGMEVILVGNHSMRLDHVDLNVWSHLVPWEVWKFTG